MSMRMFHSQIGREDLERLKKEISSLLTSEWKSSKYGTEANVFYQEAERLVLKCNTEDEVRKLVIGCLTLAFITDDSKYRTKLSKYSFDEILAASQNSETGSFLRTKVPHYTAENHYIYTHVGSTYDDYPSEDSFMSTFYNVANYVLQNPLGCDDIDKTYYLKSNAFIASIGKPIVTADQIAQTAPQEPFKSFTS